MMPHKYVIIKGGGGGVHRMLVGNSTVYTRRVCDFDVMALATTFKHYGPPRHGIA